MKLEFARDHLCRILSVGRSSRATAVDIWGDVMDFFAVFVRHDISLSGPCVRSQNDAILENDTNYGGTGTGCFGHRVPFSQEPRISLHIIKGEPSLWAFNPEIHFVAAALIDDIKI